MLTMEFFEDIDEDFGEKLGVGDVIKMLENSNISAQKRRKRRNNTKVIVFEDEIDEDEYTYYDTALEDPLSDPDIDINENIAREVKEVTQNRMLNEQLEQHYSTIAPKKKPDKNTSKLSPMSQPTVLFRSVRNQADTTSKQENQSRIVPKKNPVEKISFPVSQRTVQFQSTKNKAAKTPKQKNKSCIATKEVPTKDKSSPAIRPIISTRGTNKTSKIPNQANKKLPNCETKSNKKEKNTSIQTSVLQKEISMSKNSSKKNNLAMPKNKATPMLLKKSANEEFKPKNVISYSKVLSNSTPKPVTKNKPEKYLPGSYNHEFKFKKDDFPAIR